MFESQIIYSTCSTQNYKMSWKTCFIKFNKNIELLNCFFHLRDKKKVTNNFATTGDNKQIDLIKNQNEQKKMEKKC